MLDNDKFIATNLYETTNYDQFLFLEKNRVVCGTTVLNSIKKKNLLIDNPMLVTQKKIVLDGQHRLIAAQLLQVPIYYKFSQATSVDDICHLQNQKPWSIKDFSWFYKDLEVYKFINMLSVDHKFPLHFIIQCIDTSKNAFKKFRNNECEIKQKKEIIENMFAQLNELVNVIKNFITTCGLKKYHISNKFKRALWIFMQKENYDQKRLLHAFKTYPQHVLDLLVINSEPHILHGLENRLYNYNRRYREKLLD